MALYKTDILSPMQTARLNDLLSKRYNFSSCGIKTLREWIDMQPHIEKSESDGMIQWSRTRFNRMNHKEQAAYEARLKARRFFYINGTQVPKTVFDAIAG